MIGSDIPAVSRKLSRNIGVMQGRLSPPVEGRIQAFPAVDWELEFPRAHSIGLNSIEWIFETPIAENPLWSEAGLASIRRSIQSTRIQVEFICADVFMESPWVGVSRSVSDQNRAILHGLIDRAARLGCRGIEIPCVDASEIRSRQQEDELVAGISPCLDHAQQAGIEIGLETSLPPLRFAQLLERFAHPAVRANYDTGNSASLGYCSREEIGAYGHWINNVHIKDRVLGGSTVPLGKGDANIPGVLATLKDAGYKGGFVLQGARDGDEYATVSKYREKFDTWLAEVNREFDGTNA